MTDDRGSGVSRRSFVGWSAASGAALLWARPAVAGSVPVEGMHLQFGADAASQVTASWLTQGSVSAPRLRLGTPEGGVGTEVAADTRTYVDGATGVEVISHHVELDRLRPSTSYIYEVLHDGAAPTQGSFRTGPDGRAPFRFTSFGDQGTGDASDVVSGPAGAAVVDQIEWADPLLHLLNGDLCYANVNSDRTGVWRRFLGNNARSARYRPWMPAAGNHENERGNGPHGFDAYTTQFALPGNGGTDFAGYWYDFTVGSVRFISLQNDDVCYQDGGNTYIRGYSAGAQRLWLASRLAAAREDLGIDWIVVVMHQLGLSSAEGNGADLGIREEWLPLFDRYGVDLVLCGHDHDYERSHPVHGVEPTSATLTPRVTGTATDVIDTSRGTVHMTLGGGGTAIPTNAYGGDVAVAPTAKVITGRSTTEREPAPWSAVRDPLHPWGFAAFDVDPGTSGGTTRICVTYYRTALTGGTPEPFDTFVLERPRTDAPAA